jgi:hypothetical protein
MNNLWYSFRELKNGIIFKLIILIQIVLAIFLLYKANEIRNYEYSKLNLIQNITKDKTIYTFASKYDSPDDLAKDSMEGNKFSNFSEAIQKRYGLVTATFGEVFMENFQNINEFIDNDGTSPGDKYKAINSLQCNSGFFSTFDIKLSQGNTSEFDKFTKLSSTDTQGKIIPVILGDSYRGIFNLNDIIKTKYTKLKVVGFLEKNQFYLDKGMYDPNSAKSLDTYMIVPSPSDIQNGNLINSLLVSNSQKEDLPSVENYIDMLSKKYDVKFSVNDPSDNINDFVNILTYNANIKILLVYIVMFFVVIALLAIFTNRINAKRKEFSVHLMHGATYMDIYIRVILENIYLLILSIIIAFYYIPKTQDQIGFEVLKFDLVALEQSIVTIFIIMIIVATIPIYNISKNRINYLIKGE